MRPVHSLPHYFLKIHSNISLPSMRRSSEWSTSFRFSKQNIARIFHFSRDVYKEMQISFEEELVFMTFPAVCLVRNEARSAGLLLQCSSRPQQVTFICSLHELTSRQMEQTAVIMDPIYILIINVTQNKSPSTFAHILYKDVIPTDQFIFLRI
jgi:hypothetical protein